MSRSQRTLLIVLVIALLGVLAVSTLHEDGEDLARTRGPEVLTPSALAGVAAESNRPVYWIGPRSGAKYELTETSQGRVYVRYLRDGTEPGNERADFVTVATYPAVNAVNELLRAARNPGAKLKRSGGGAFVLIEQSSPKSVHLAFPGVEPSVQVEVYSPFPDHALRLASRDEVQRIR
jgi:hypothetical protein